MKREREGGRIEEEIVVLLTTNAREDIHHHSPQGTRSARLPTPRDMPRVRRIALKCHKPVQLPTS